MESKPVAVAITPGDVNGIGPEIILRLFLDNRFQQDITPILYGNEKVFSFYRKTLDGASLGFNKIRQASQAKAGQINLVTCWEGEVNVEPGKITREAGALSVQALEAAFADVAAGHADVLVTAPLNKENSAEASPGFTGHTGWLATKAGAPDVLMILMNDSLRVGLVTEHIPVSAIAAAITPALLEARIKRMEQSLRVDFGIRKPRIGVLGLNPHAGDNGLIGPEEQSVIEPAIRKMRAEKDFLVYGPYPADGIFGSGKYTTYDGILAMYHDQGLAPFKALSFGQGVNFTAGLPFVRTSPDHGTAYDIAGKGTASEESIRQAIYTAIDVHRRRMLEKDLKKNPLKTTELSRERS